MTKKELQISVAKLFVESDMSKKDILDAVKFVKTEATESDLKFILYDYVTEQQINKTLTEAGTVRTARKTAMSAVGAGVADAAIAARAVAKAPSGLKGAVAKHAGKQLAVGVAGWAAYRAALAIFGQCTKKCGTFKLNTPSRQMCIAKCKLERARKMGDKPAITKWSRRVEDYKSQGHK